MKRHLATVLFAVCATVTMSGQGAAPDFVTRARDAAKVILASVEHVQPRFDVNQYGDRLIISRTLLRVEETLKGTPGGIVELDMEGGTIGDLTLHVSDLPVLRQGDRAVFFLTEASSNVHRLRGRGLGVVRLDAANKAAGSLSTLADIRAAVRAAR